MAKDKPWTKKEKQTFIQLVSKGKAVDVISQALDKSEDDVFIKLRRLGLEVVVGEKINPLLLLVLTCLNCRASKTS